MNTKTQQIADKLTAAGYTVTSQTDVRGDLRITARNRSLAASVAGQADGRIHAAMFVDYGDDGTSYCDSADLKSVAGVVRRVSTFLGATAA